MQIFFNSQGKRNGMTRFHHNVNDPPSDSLFNQIVGGFPEMYMSERVIIYLSTDSR